MGLTGFNRQRRLALEKEVGEKRAAELIAQGVDAVEKLSRLEEVFTIQGDTPDQAKEKATAIRKSLGSKPDAPDPGEDKTVKQIEKLVSETEDLDELSKILEQETAGKKRKTAIQAIQDRIDELSEEPNAPDPGEE